MKGFNHPALVRSARVLLSCAAVVIAVMAFTPLMAKLPIANLSDKFYHITAFTVLTILAVVSFPRSRPWVLAVALLSFGLMIEVIQSVPALRRSAEGLDVVADAIGISAGFTVCLLLHLALLRRSKLLVAGY